MTHGFRISAAIAGGAAVVALISSSILSSADQSSTAPAPAAYLAPRLDGKPNLSGLWQAMNEANWDIQAHVAQPAQPGPDQFGALFAEPGGVGVVEGDELPYQPWALKKKQENFANRFTRTTADGTRFEPLDQEAKCYMPGVPRATYLPFPFQIVQSTNKMIIAYEYANTSRLIHFGKTPSAPADSYMGWSVAHFEGETLVIEVTDLNEKTWFDRAGNFHSNEMHVVERYTRTSPDVMQYEATITDPKVFTRPWKMSMPLYRRQEKNAQFIEFKCVPFSEELIYGFLRKEPKKSSSNQ
jgi:hypothetical protein